MDDYLSAEELIKTRVKTQVVELATNTFSAADMAGVSEAEQFTPAAHVLYYGDRVAEGQGRSSNGECQCVDQVWYVILVFRNVRDTVTGQAVRAEAGPVIKKVLKALQGWQLTNEHGPLKRVNGPAPGHRAGFLYIPLCFTTRVTV